MSRGLGKLERDILLAVYHRQVVTETEREDDPILRRDELPELLWGWRPVDIHWYQLARTYCRFDYPDYNAKQAALTRALHSLERKELIITGNSSMCEGRFIYNERQAAARGIEPEKTLRERCSDEELDQLVQTPSGKLVRIRNLKHLDVQELRNAKTLRLTETGMLQAAALACAACPDAGRNAGSISVKSQTHFRI